MKLCECRWVEYEWVQAVRTNLLASKHTPTEANPQMKRGNKKKTLTLFWRLHNSWVGKIYCIVIFAAFIGGLKWMCWRDSTHSTLNVNHSLEITWTHMQHKTSEVCVHTTHNPFQLKVKQYYLNVTTERGGVYQFQGTGLKRRCVFKLAE